MPLHYWFTVDCCTFHCAALPLSCSALNCIVLHYITLHCIGAKSFRAGRLEVDHGGGPTTLLYITLAWLCTIIASRNICALSCIALSYYTFHHMGVSVFGSMLFSCTQTGGSLKHKKSRHLQINHLVFPFWFPFKNPQQRGYQLRE